jgi:hypothetical protein
VQAGPTAEVQAQLSPLQDLSEEEQVFFADLLDKVPLCTVERDMGAAAPAQRAGKMSAPRGNDAVVLWLEGSGALGEGPIADVFNRLRQLCNKLPSLRPNPHVSTLSQSELQYLAEVIGEYVRLNGHVRSLRRPLLSTRTACNACGVALQALCPLSTPSPCRPRTRRATKSLMVTTMIPGVRCWCRTTLSTTQRVVGMTGICCSHSFCTVPKHYPWSGVFYPAAIETGHWIP